MDVERSGGRWKVYEGVAEITVVDANGSPVQGATVQGSWTAGYSNLGSNSQNTDNNGQAVSRSGQTWWDVTFTYCVDNITKAGWTYDSSANSETCDSASY